ncbi:MAG: hypothetical protein LBT84_06020 [Spirochaetia bacterium]|jgi:hypothetical protein|nr:hypothetical protein [Spirochaetia bacterium]
MKKIIISFLFIAFAGTFCVNALLAEYDVAEVYVCADTSYTAEFEAKVLVNHNEITVASYCKCDQLPPENKDKVRKGKWQKQGFEFEYGSCTPPKDKVFRCFCVGKTDY